MVSVGIGESAGHADMVVDGVAQITVEGLQKLVAAKRAR